MDLPLKRTVPGPKSASFLEISREFEPPCIADQVPVVWDHASGVWVTDVDGRQYIDFVIEQKLRDVNKETKD